tara:strand:- start:21 stop:533 length:513 start_codon:yes stop_codon:yes gene_type:complete
MKIESLYTVKKMSLHDIHRATGIPVSTIRFRLARLGVLRSIRESLAIASKQGKLSSLKGRKVTFTEEWKKNISNGIAKYWESRAKGVSLKATGYVEVTRGEHKGRRLHNLIVEAIIGRRLFVNECVHHKDENRSNNDPENLQLMTRSEHARLHGKINYPQRKRNHHGQFE